MQSGRKGSGASRRSQGAFGAGRHGHPSTVWCDALERRVLMTAVTSFTLINADTDQPMAGYSALTNGATLDLSKLPTKRMNVRANVDATTRSVRFAYDANTNYRVESGAPFALASDNGGDYAPWTPTVGAHTVKATPYTLTGASGTAGTALAVKFNVVNGIAPAVDLMNSATDTKIATLTDGYVIDKNQVGARVTIRALPVGAAGSIVFKLDGQIVSTETYAPYSIGGDIGGDLQDWSAPAGQHALQVTQYSGPTGTGTVQGTTALSFTVVDPAAVPGVTVTAATATTLDLSWTAPADAAEGEITAYRISYAPGEYDPGPAGQWQVVEVPGTATSVQLSGLLSFALYSIDVAAVRADGVGAAAHVNARTAKPVGMSRYLYLVDAPKNTLGFEQLKPQIEVFDIENGHRWVKNIPLPSGIYNIRGVAASPATGKLYVSYFLTAVNGYQPGGLLCLDMNTSRVLWRKDYPASVVPSPDRFDITPDGKKIYMPVGEHGPDRFWVVIDAANGNALGRIYHTTAPHNTIVSLDGRYAFLEGQEKGTQPADVLHTIGVVDTATDQVVRKIGPFNEVVRPFTVNGSTTLVFATINDFVGFQVGDVRTGRVIFTAPVPGATQPSPDFNRVICHGIALTPDEREIWLVDTQRVGIHVFDVSGVRSGRAPTYIKFIQTRRPGRDLSGNYDPNASRDAHGVPAWLNRSHDGKYIYGELGEIIDVATKRVVGQLRAKELNASGQLVDAPYSHSRFMLEVDVLGGRVVRATDQFGVGLVR